MQSEPTRHLAHCGFCEQGLLRLMRCQNCEEISAVCDECELTWSELDAVRQQPDVPSESAHPECPNCGAKKPAWRFLDDPEIAAADLDYLFNDPSG